MKKLSLILFILVTVISYSKGTNDNNSNGNNTGNQSMIQTSNQGSDSNLELKNEYKYTVEQNKILDEKTNIHYQNLTKIMEKYKYSIKNELEYNKFYYDYEHNFLNVDKETLEMLKFEFERHNSEMK